MTSALESFEVVGTRDNVATDVAEREDARDAGQENTFLGILMEV